MLTGTRVRRVAGSPPTGIDTRPGVYRCIEATPSPFSATHRGPKPQLSDGNHARQMVSTN